MGTLTVPRTNELQKMLFEKFSITLIDSMSEQEFEKAVIEYLNNHNVLHLATCRDNQVRSTPLEYFNNDLTVYISSEGGGKFANLIII
jgi:nitroimidazol reductase NimA-like FMN-containing flavoprotein (pyridoxamine 5'-phosphate oxidase superfamily)